MSLFVIIPSRNADNLEPCIRAIRSAGEDCRIIVVDDGLARRPDGCEYIAGVKPFVFARNANAGITATYPDDVILLNDDALLQTPGGFTRLQSEALLHPEYGLIGATSNNVGNLNQQPQGTYRLREEPKVVCFICVYIPRWTFLKIGMLDERFTTYGWDDNDFCRRVQKAGLKLGIHDGVYVDHGSLVSSFRGAAGAGGDIEPGRQIFLSKWGVQ